MMRQTDKKADDALVLTGPRSSLEQNGLSADDHMELEILGRRISAQIAIRPRYKLADLLAEMPSGFPRVEGWDEMQYVGLERF
jgi:antitoxin ChpS